MKNGSERTVIMWAEEANTNLAFKRMRIHHQIETIEKKTSEKQTQPIVILLTLTYSLQHGSKYLYTYKER